MTREIPYFVDWESEENSVFINPRFSTEQKDYLFQGIREATNHLKGHVFILSSGTTASSSQDLKWVALSKKAFLAAAASSNHHLRSDHSDIWLHSLPEFHVGGLSIWARSYLSRAQVVCFEKWNCEVFQSELVRQKATLTSLVPTQVYDLVQGQCPSPKSLRAVLVGGGALSNSLYTQARKLGWPLLPTYGMTETCSQVATASLSSLEHPIVTFENEMPELEVLSHLKVRVGEENRIQICGDSLFTGYIERGVFADPKISGWFHSQDRGELSGNLLKILGRVGDFIKIGGESVEVGRLRSIFEEGRIQLGICKDVVLCPVPDDRLGHVIHLFAERALSEEDLKQLSEYYNRRVLAFEKIRRCHRIDQIPRTELGKLIPSRILEYV